MKVAIVHYWLVGMRGGEKVLESLCNLFPDCDIYTHVYCFDAVSKVISRHGVHTTFINKLPFANRLYKKYLPLMPLALEHVDLRGYDLIISSESGPAKGIIPPPNSVHICYCHSPMRYIWNMYHEYKGGSGRLTQLLMPSLCHYLRMWDQSAAARVDDFVANSETVAARIRKYYRREAVVIPPPVSVHNFQPVGESEIGEFHLMVGELVPYKRPEIAIEAFNKMGKKLVVIGGGEMLDKMRRLAGPNVEIMGPQPGSVLADYFSRCKALIFPGEEDFGIVPVEAMASGRPVIAFGRGGATETVVPGLSGVLFEDQSVEALIHAVSQAEAIHFEPKKIVIQAQKFSSKRFEADMMSHIDKVLSGAGKRVERRASDEIFTPSVRWPERDSLPDLTSAAAVRLDEMMTRY
jgi:glycosyltransferase involved in cell wall biosynthesis